MTPTSQRIWLGLCSALIVIGCIAGLSTFRTTYALHIRDVEVVFLVTDITSGKPIQDASIELVIQGDQDTEKRVARLVTNQEGKAAFVQEKVFSDDIIRPFRKTHTTFDLTWAVFSVIADGHDSIEKNWLHAWKYENKGYSPDRKLWQLEVPVMLAPVERAN